MPHSKMLTEEMRRCIEICTNCHNICVETITHCLMMGGEHADADHIRLLMDCAEICDVSADFMLRGSHRHEKVCGVCADVCADCASDCERIAGNDETMLRCAEICRMCAESCRQTSRAMA
jgi:hypothetical protein